MRESTQDATDGVRWVRTWEDTRTGTFRIGRSADQLVAEWVGQASLRATRDGKEFEFSVVSGCDAAWAEKLRRGHAAALVRHLTGGLTLHASAVAIGQRAVLFLGESGSGKSTTAADFCERAGAAFLGDDTAALVAAAGAFCVSVTEPDSWLTEEAYGALGLPVRSPRKLPFRPRRLGVKPVRLGAMFKLTFDDDYSGCRVARLAGREAFAVLSTSLFRFIIDEPEALAHDFERLASLACRVPLYEMRRPRDLSALSAARSSVLALVSQDMSVER